MFNPIRLAASAFVGFAVLAVVTIPALIASAPESADPVAEAIAVVFFISVATASLITARDLQWRNRTVVGFLLIGFLTFTIIGGWLQCGALDDADPLPPIVKTLRAVDGL